MNIKSKLPTATALAVACSALLWSLHAQVIIPKSKHGPMTERDKGFFLLGGALTALEIQKREHIPILHYIAEIAWSNFVAGAVSTNAP